MTIPGSNELTYICDYDENIFQPNVMFEMGQDNPSVNESKRFTVPELLLDREYYDLCDSLNAKQKDYLMHVLNLFKLKETPFYHFISGGAGVGKSRLIKAVFQTVTRLFRSEPGSVDAPEVLIVAYTGKAAHNVNGMTAHTTFSLTMVDGIGGTFKGLGPEALNTLRVKLPNLKLIIIDEVSLMGLTTFEKINHRLRQIFRPTGDKIFGGRPMIVFGDFNQLRPVRDQYVFETGKGELKNVVGASFRCLNLLK